MSRPDSIKSSPEVATPQVPVSSTTSATVQQIEQHLIEAIARCESELRRGAEDLARLKDALQRIRQPKRPTGGLRKTEPDTTPRRPGNIAGSERAGSAASIIRSFVRSELRKAGRPLNRTEILERLLAAGIPIDSKAPLKRVAKVMWMASDFENVGDGYWFADEPLPR